MVTSPLYLYNNGNWNGLKVTGATVINPNIGNYVITLALYSSYMSMNHTNNDSERSVCRLNSPVNISSYSYLNLKFYGARKTNPISDVGGIGISQNSQTTNLSSMIEGTDISNDNASTIISLNISGVNGDWFIYFTGRSGCSVASTIIYEQIYLT